MNYKIRSAGKNRIAVALSGGIDSAISAYILKSEGYDVFGITFMLYGSDDFNKQLESVRNIAGELSIEYHAEDLSDFFEEAIIEPFCRDYIRGITPNPCVECNKIIKFGILWEKAKKLKADYMATGHYARLFRPEGEDGYRIKKGLDTGKDQSYFLWKLQQELLDTIKLPLGCFTKKQVRQKARAVFPRLHVRQESQEICFIGGKSYQEFLFERYKGKDVIKKGTVFNTDGNIMGTHKGHPLYTVGQRRGLGISHSKPLYIKEIVPEKNIIVVGEEKEIFRDTFHIRDLNFISGDSPGKIFKASTRIRYNSPEFPAEIELLKNNRALIKTKKPQKAVTPGQSAVFYEGDELIGGGIIE